MEFDRNTPLIDQLCGRWTTFRRLARESALLAESANQALDAIDAAPSGAHAEAASVRFESLKASTFDRIRATAKAVGEYERLEKQCLQSETAKCLVEMGHSQLVPRAFES
ncbi:MAG: hypothetical protein JJU00_12770 [Opitutales bacterium]|nr:hypothetical protein [Opitutales bacterium]